MIIRAGQAGSPAARRGTRRIALALAEAIFPPSARLPGADEATLAQLERLAVERAGPLGATALRAAVAALDLASRARTGRSFADLDARAQQRLLAIWARSRAPHGELLRAATGAVALAHLDRARVREHLAPPREAVAAAKGLPRGVCEATAWPDEDVIECDVVVVGTGAGGAVLGATLAERGHAVVFVEQGGWHARSALGGPALDAYARLYAPSALALGNVRIPIFSGRMVGGSTAINTGSCHRAPPWAHERWADLVGDVGLERSAFDPYYDEIERALAVAPCPEHLAGPIADVFRRGCEAIGATHGPVARNAPDCEAGGFCDFGCARGARRSVDVSFVPRALARGALVLTRARVERVVVEGRDARGVVARDTRGRALEIRARAVVLAAGALRTPALLARTDRLARLRTIGAHLRVQPSAGIAGVMPERMGAFSHVPQGWASDDLLGTGILVVAANPDPSVAAMVLGQVGAALSGALDAIDRTAVLGVLTADLESEGRLARALGDHPIALYRLTSGDRARIARGVARAGEILRCAGARRILPLTARPRVVDGERAWRDFERTELGSADLRLLSFHPMGTCRMASDPARGVVDLDHRVFGIERLFVVDASAIPGPLGVNPQLTIMAAALRAAGAVEREIAG